MQSRQQKRTGKQDLHFQNEDGMVACNPRDREAAHRAEMEGIATHDAQAVTCKKCRARMHDPNESQVVESNDPKKDRGSQGPDPRLTHIAPLFIVRELVDATAWYLEVLGFELLLATPKEMPFFAIVARDGVQIHLKVITEDVQAQPNSSRHPWAAWDAFVHCEDPDVLATEFEGRKAVLHAPLLDREGGLRGFEMRDRDGYVLFFGRPVR